MSTNSFIDISAVIRMTMATIKPDGLPPVVSLYDSPQAQGTADEEATVSRAAKKCGATPALWFSSSATVADIVKGIKDAVHPSGAVPKLIGLARTGIFSIGIDKKDADAIYSSVAAGSTYVEPSEEGLRLGRLASCIAIVTGSAQGFGKGIAEEMAKEGAYILVSDLNDQAGMAFATELNKHHGPGTALYCHTDVANQQSVTDLVATAVRSFGGLDMFVANAGVLKAGGLDEMDEKAFDLVTNVNYKAFFLCAKAAAPVMKQQHQFNPAHFMDIVQINSKSGLEGSNRNFAYAGSKFGAIGLMHSFAMELVEHNIRVNAICPGNYYEGPLWSDPKTGLFVQYLKTGKVPSAKTIEDVKQFYMTKVPMRRGCSPLDVARAIFYVHEQEYETGQAIPVTGGQVMLS